MTVKFFVRKVSNTNFGQGMIGRLFVLGKQQYFYYYFIFFIVLFVVVGCGGGLTK